jgi:hypothetical protein
MSIDDDSDDLSPYADMLGVATGPGGPTGVEPIGLLDSSGSTTATSTATGQTTSIPSSITASVSQTLSSDCQRHSPREGLKLYGVARQFMRVPEDHSKEQALYSQSVMVVYKQNRATTIPTASGSQTVKQFIACGSGGAQAKGGNRLQRFRVTVFARTAIPRLLNKDWGNGVQNGNVTTSLGFTGGSGVSAGVQSTDQDRHTGSVGLPWHPLPGVSSFEDNTVTGLWENNGIWRWSGSKNWQGNVALALFQMPQSTRNPVFHAGGGGGGPAAPAPSRPSPETASGSPAPRIAGQVVVLCGRDDFSMDLYTIRDGMIERRTESPSGAGVHNFSLAGSTIAFTRYHDGFDHVEVADLDARTFDGRTVGPGTLPAVGEDGTLAWSLVTERSGHYADSVHVGRVGGRARRVATYPHVWAQQFVGARLHTIVSKRGAFLEVRGVGLPSARTTRLAMTKPGLVAWSAGGKLAYGSGRIHGNRLRILAADRRAAANYKTDWQPLAWSPDERTLLVATGGNTAPVIGLLDSRTGTVNSLGAVSCGRVAAARWL